MRGEKAISVLAKILELALLVTKPVDPVLSLPTKMRFVALVDSIEYILLNARLKCQNFYTPELINNGSFYF
jgi:hypothetical protein